MYLGDNSEKEMDYFLVELGKNFPENGRYRRIRLRNNWKQKNKDLNTKKLWFCAIMTHLLIIIKLITKSDVNISYKL